MATAKRSKKKTVKKSKKVKLNAHQRLEQATTVEELMEGLPVVEEEHAEQVRLLGKKLIAVVEKGKFHPIIVLDTLQLLLSAGVGSALGERHQELWDAAVHRYHEESKMLTLVEMLEGLEQFNQQAEEVLTTEEPAPVVGTPEEPQK